MLIIKVSHAVARWFALTAALLGTPAWGARTLQGEMLLDGVPAVSEQITAGLQRYSGGSATRFLDWLSDGSVLVAVHEHGQDHLSRLSAAAAQGAGAAPQDLAGTAAGALHELVTQPFHNEWLAYLKEEAVADAGRGAALYLSPLTGGAARLLVDGAARPAAPVWAHDGRRLAFSATLRDGQNSDLYILDTSSPAGPRLIVMGDTGKWQVLAWTSTDQALLVQHSVAAGGDELLLADIATGALRRVDAPGDPAPAYGPIDAAQLAPDSRGIYLLTRRDSDYAQLRYVDLYGGATTVVGPKLSYDIEHFDVSANGRSVAYAWNENGYSRAAVFDRKTAAARTITDLPAGVIAALKFDRSGARLAIELAASTAPRDVYVYELSAASSARWTDSRLGELNPAQLIAPLTVRFPTWDRLNGRTRTLNAQIYRPRAVASPPPGPAAVLVMLHDAPDPAGPQLDAFVQYCVNELRLTVIAPDLRSGESGALDLGALLAWIGAQPDLRRDRVAIQGSGTGGTLALTGLGLYAERLRAAISIDGRASSAQIAAVRQPVLLVRGLLTPALDAGSAEQLLWRLRNANVDSGLVAPRDAQGLLNSDAAQSAVQQLIAQFLLNQLGQ